MTERNIYQAIRAALDARLLTLAELPLDSSGLPLIHWEGTQFRPVVGSAFLRTHLIPAEPGGRSAGGTHWTRLSGIYYVDAFAPSDAKQGTGDVERLSDAIHRHFSSGTRLSEKTTNVTITQVSRSAVMSDAAWIWLQTLIYWRSFTDRV